LTCHWDGLIGRPSGESWFGQKEETTNEPAKNFISYAHKDRDPALAMAQALKKVDLEAWIDERSLSPGQNWIAEIENALAEAGYLLALISATSLQSLWVQQEWTAMLSRQLAGAGGGVVIPLRLDDVEPAASPSNAATHRSIPRF
jgi:hypothetical protein